MRAMIELSSDPQDKAAIECSQKLLEMVIALAERTPEVKLSDNIAKMCEKARKKTRQEEEKQMREEIEQKKAEAKREQERLEKERMKRMTPEQLKKLEEKQRKKEKSKMKGRMMKMTKM